MFKILPAIAFLPLMACGASVIESTPDGVWLKKPFMGLGSPESVAQEHCAQFGKTAVYKSTMHPADGNKHFMPIIVYDCRK
jgi:hypothetical protein